MNGGSVQSSVGDWVSDAGGWIKENLDFTGVFGETQIAVSDGGIQITTVDRNTPSGHPEPLATPTAIDATSGGNGILGIAVMAIAIYAVVYT